MQERVEVTFVSRAEHQFHALVRPPSMQVPRYRTICTAPIIYVSESVAEDPEVERVERAVLDIDVCAQREQLVYRR